jgi:hypothetical protein
LFVWAKVLDNFTAPTQSKEDVSGSLSCATFTIIETGKVKCMVYLTSKQNGFFFTIIIYVTDEYWGL